MTKEAFCDLRIIFPDMPAACDQALMKTIRNLPVPSRKFAFRPAFALALVLLLALTCAAGAAFHPQLINWFTALYGENWGEWMQQGSVAVPHFSTEAKGAVFTIDEVLTRDRSLYILGRVEPQDGYFIADYDSFKAPEAGSNLRYVHIGLERIGVDGGAMLAPATWGFAVEEKDDGTLGFSIEAEDGMAIQPGTEYTIELYAHTQGTHADGSVNLEDRDEITMTFTVIPEKINE